MLNEIANHFFATFTDEDGQVAFLAVHLLSGRTKIKPILLEVDPEITARVVQRVTERRCRARQ